MSNGPPWSPRRHRKQHAFFSISSRVTSAAQQIGEIFFVSTQLPTSPTWPDAPARTSQRAWPHSAKVRDKSTPGLRAAAGAIGRASILVEHVVLYMDTLDHCTLHAPLHRARRGVHDSAFVQPAALLHRTCGSLEYCPCLCFEHAHNRVTNVSISLILCCFCMRRPNLHLTSVCVWGRLVLSSASRR